MSEEKKLRIEKVHMTEDGRYGKFVCEPLDRGYGITLGNSLRRILLSSLDGAAITSIKINDVLHEFSTIEGVREDVSDIILNLKQLCLRIDEEASVPMEVHIDVRKDGVLTAADLIQFMPPEIEVLNPELVIATMDEAAHLVMDVRIERGKGYVPSTKNKREDDQIGQIPIDSIFSPILRAKYEVSDVRVGNEMDFDKLTLEVWTNGSISASDAIAKSAAIMISYLGNFTRLAHSHDMIDIGDNDAELTTAGGQENSEVEAESNGPTTIPIEDLELSVRAFNCLKRANIHTIGDLTGKTEDELGKIRNLGKKSVDEILEKLKSYNDSNESLTSQSE
ncbi:DNA-directed RNA polymerase subunit alpha [Veillonella sp. CHU740]|uniref:DNA-directed RNA polymerase subunit alpha n=1 Tax=Veillonella sp. CHU740 TaxID=2490950 RepID=UPI000F8C5CCC|nr:DNA-directed RNA polymerase subunit alpha [Veillonella sp. CHU740]